MNNQICLDCKESFSSLKALHSHIKKHNVCIGDYYVKYFAKKDKWTKKLLQFKSFDDYFARDFSSRSNMLKWCEKASIKELQEFLTFSLKRVILEKNLKFAPTSTDLYTRNLPTIDIFKKAFGSYKGACEICNISASLGRNLTPRFKEDFSNEKIYVDTREQKPLKFKNSESLKLDIGDYAVGGDLYNYTYVDRKSFGDFCGTMTRGFDRFKKELDRCKSLNCYLFVVIETDLYSIERTNKFSPKKYKLDFVFHQMRSLQYEYHDCCQFVFSGGRENSINLIPKLLILGKDLWETDVQYFIDKEIIEK